MLFRYFTVSYVSQCYSYSGILYKASSLLYTNFIHVNFKKSFSTELIIVKHNFRRVVIFYSFYYCRLYFVKNKVSNLIKYTALFFFFFLYIIVTSISVKSVLKLLVNIIFLI